MSSAICVISIGDEVLSGMILNRNSHRVALALTNRGWNVVEQMVLPDDPKVIKRVLRERLLQGVTIITIGGLGPTVDDYTRKVVADLFHQTLVFFQEIYDSICGRFGSECPTARDQAMQPQGAVLFKNLSGTAPGLLLQNDSLFAGARLFSLPGPFLEMEDLFSNQIIPAFFPPLSMKSRLYTIYGVVESEVDPILRTIHNEIPQIRIGIYPAYDTVKVRFILQDQTIEQVLDKAELMLKENLGKAIFLDPLISVEEQIYRSCARRSWTIATAESCTGGAIASRLTAIPGVSSVFVGGMVAYQNWVKEEFLHLSSDILKEYDVVDPVVTEQMALCARSTFRTDIAVATSGYFGPSGGSPKAPIGTVCYTICTPQSMYTTTRHFVGSRETICEKTVQAVLARLCVEIL